MFNKLKDGTQGKTMKFVINFYHTNSRMMINGTRVDLFVSDIYKQLCEILNNHFNELNILNKDIFDKINNTQQSYNHTNHSVNTPTTTIVTNSVCTLSVADGCCCFLVVLFSARFKSELNVFGVGDRAFDMVAFVELLRFAIDCF
jgi:hypothetical protein